MTISWGVSWLRSWGNSWGAISPLTPNVSTGGVSPDDYKRYRDYLERLVGIKKTDVVTEKVIEAVEVIKELPIKTKTIEKIVTKKEIDFTALDKEMAAILAYLDRMERKAIALQERIRKQQDDDLALLLLLS